MVFKVQALGCYLEALSAKKLKLFQNVIYETC
jgi:hypothetical protein